MGVQGQQASVAVGIGRQFVVVFARVGAGDQANIDKLLQTMNSVTASQRQAAFHCVLVYLQHAQDPTPLICHASWQGEIAAAKSGSGGFGYDPVFFVSSEGCTSAELSRERKAQLSHRGQALAQLIALFSQHGIEMLKRFWKAVLLV